MGLGNDRSKAWPSYTGSKLRFERNARNFPSGVKAGDSSQKRPSVTSTMSPGLAVLTMRNLLREPKDVTGSDHASHCESGDHARPSMLPSPTLTSRDKVPLAVSAR
ncbi:hypothetical protein AHiyo8_11360 [Arthrobacter sp. Hiyo8]|nr:hypothetical protein AHiyo8_11360 [Arthrobacter sp. Hiyo8]